MATVYEVNKGINRSLEFKGIKAQYITYLALGLVLLLLLFAILHVIGAGLYVCMSIVVPAGGALVISIQRISKKYGQHGLMKRAAARSLPNSVRSRSRKLFHQLKAQPHAEN